MDSIPFSRCAPRTDRSHAYTCIVTRSVPPELTRLFSDASEPVTSSTPPFTKVVPEEYINKEGNNVLNNYREYVGPLVGDLPKPGWFEQIG